MKLELDRREAALGSVDLTVTAVPERGEKEEGGLPRLLTKDDKAFGGLLAKAWERREIRGKKKDVPIFHRADGKGRVAVVGLGPRGQVDAEAVRRAAADAVRRVKGLGIRTVGFRLEAFVSDKVDSETAVRAIADGAALGAYEFVRYKSSHESGVEETTIYLGEPFQREESALRRALEQESSILESVLWTRDVLNVPADTATPEWLAEEARGLAKEFGLKVQVFDEQKLAEMQCGGLLSVGGGSARPPRMIVLEYSGGSRSGKTVAVVGKGITFDSGGISLKEAPRMSNMKFDKSGACAVLGIVRAAAALKLPPRVIGVLACAENLPGGSAYRPGDVVRTYNGKTIEVLNTDAEGRVVLADALGYVVDKYHPDEIIDLATLTGAAVVALGIDMAGVISNDDKLAQGLLAASLQTGEGLWRLPLTETHREMVKSEIADVRNSTEIPPAGALTASAFLENFAGRTPWAHLDIAGPAYVDAISHKYVPSYFNWGGTGFGVRLVTRYLMDGAR